MKKKVIKLTEADLVRIVRKTINESTDIYDYIVESLYKQTVWNDKENHFEYLFMGKGVYYPEHDEVIKVIKNKYGVTDDVAEEALTRLAKRLQQEYSDRTGVR